MNDQNVTFFQINFDFFKFYYAIVYRKKSMRLISGWEGLWEQMNKDPDLMETLKKDAQRKDDDSE